MNNINRMICIQVLIGWFVSRYLWGDFYPGRSGECIVMESIFLILVLWIFWEKTLWVKENVLIPGLKSQSESALFQSCSSLVFSESLLGQNELGSRRKMLSKCIVNSMHRRFSPTLPPWEGNFVFDNCSELHLKFSQASIERQANRKTVLLRFRKQCGDHENCLLRQAWNASDKRNCEKSTVYVKPQKVRCRDG